MAADGPIAVIASGAGGLAVAHRLAAALPHEDVVLLADHAYAPYAARPPRIVIDRVSGLAAQLVGDGAKLLVLASAAATGDALGAVRARVGGVAVIGFDGVLRRATIAADGAPLVAVVGEGCLRGLPHARALRQLRASGGVTTVAWPGLVALVEAGRACDEEAHALAAREVQALRGAGAGVLALACAHAAAIAPAVQAAAAGLTVVDGGHVVTETVRATLVSGGLVARRRRPGRLLLMASAPDRAGGLARGARRGRSATG